MSIRTSKGTKNDDFDFLKVGAKVFIRTATVYDVGEIIGITDRGIYLKGASYIGSTDRIADTMAKGTFSEIEPFGDARLFVSHGAICDAAEWKHPLPTAQK